MRDSIARPCTTHFPQNHWRTCPRCAAGRQAAIADTAVEHLGRLDHVSWVTITASDHGTRTIDALRRAYLRAADAPTGIWTIERGEQARRLHCNILTGDHRIPAIPGASIHVANITHDLRRVAAYISKRKQVPLPTEYQGRTFGRFGTVTQMLMQPDAPAAPQAKLVEDYVLREYGPMGLADPSWGNALPPPAPPLRGPTPDPTTTAEYKAIAMRHLPRLAALAAALAGRSCSD